MDLSSAQVAEAFARHDFRAAYEYLSDKVEWNLVGSELLVGRGQVVDWCEALSQHMTKVSTRFDKFRSLAGDDWIVIESTATYLGPDEESSSVSACDIFRFADNRVIEITSYNVDLSPEEARK